MALTLLAACALSPAANAREEIIWAATLDEAWELAQEHDRPMLVFITRKNCKYCTMMKSTTYADEKVAREVNNRFVPVMVSAAAAQHLVQKLGIKSYPTTLVIAPDYCLIDEVKGYLPAAEMHRRLGAASHRMAALPPGK
jgi:thioredoxin-related protein